MVDPISSSKENLRPCLKETKEGVKVEWRGKTIIGKSIGKKLTDLWKNVSEQAKKGTPQKLHQFQRLVRLHSGLEEAVLPEDRPLSEEEARTFDTAKKTTIVKGLQLLSLENGEFDYGTLEQMINDAVQRAEGGTAEDRKREVRFLSQIASFLCSSVRVGAFAEKSAGKENRAFAAAKIALAHACHISSSQGGVQSPNELPPELCYAMTQAALQEIVFNLPSGELTAEGFSDAVSAKIDIMTKAYPSSADTIRNAMKRHPIPDEVCKRIGASLRETVAKAEADRNATGIRDGTSWDTRFEERLDATVASSPWGLDKAKLKKFVFDSVRADFLAAWEAVEQKHVPENWCALMNKAEPALQFLVDSPTEYDRMIQEFSGRFQAFSDRLFQGGDFTVTHQRPPREFLDAHDESQDPSIAKWAASCASTSIRQTFGRLGSIVVGGQTVKNFDVGSVDQLGAAYQFSQAIYRECENKMRGAKKEDIQKIVNELMMRCTGEIMMINSFGFLSALSGSSIQEAAVARPEFSQFRFSVDEKGRAAVEKVYLVQQKSPETGATVYIQCVSKIVVDPENLDHWTETVVTETYGAALAKEVKEEISRTGKKFQEVFDAKVRDLEKQVPDSADRNKVIQQMLSLFPGMRSSVEGA